MTAAELQAAANLIAELLNRALAAEHREKAWRLVAESLMGVVHKE